MKKKKEQCSFCGKPKKEAEKLIAGPDVYICEDCIEICNGILEGDTAKEQHNDSDLLKPKKIKEFLDQYIVGQEAAKKTISVGVYNHYKKILFADKDVELQKSNILMLGPTGSGKTFLIQNLAKMLNVPLAIADATSITEAGYVGEDVENILLRLIQAADYDLDKAEMGIVYIDEIDKISRRSENPSLTRDVSGEGVQQALLKLIEGTVANIPPQGGRKHPYQEYVQLNTSKILFICGGAFNGLENIVESRLNEKVIGFGTETRKQKKGVLKQVQTADLLKYGLIPEFLGRLPVTVMMDELNEDNLVQILTEPKNAIIKQYEYLLGMDGVELEFQREALTAIAKEAIKNGTGARGLRSIVEEVMLDIMYDPQAGCRYVITQNTVLEKQKPLVYPIKRTA